MKFMQSIAINKPIHEVITIFKNRENRSQWMEGYMSSTLLDGVEGQSGAISQLVFLKGKHKTNMIETIKVNKLPDEFTCTYEANGVFNIVKCLFSEISESATDFCTVQEFQLKGLLKIIALLMPWVFRKQGQKYLENFKAFCETAIYAS